MFYNVLGMFSADLITKKYNEMNEFVKKMLELGAELDQTDSPMQATMVINDAEILYNNEIKAFNIPVVMQALPKRLSNSAYRNAKTMRYEDFVKWWDEQV